MERSYLETIPRGLQYKVLKYMYSCNLSLELDPYEDFFVLGIRKGDLYVNVLFERSILKRKTFGKFISNLSQREYQSILINSGGYEMVSEDGIVTFRLREYVFGGSINIPTCRELGYSLETIYNSL